jgi:hypothetical protein
MDPCGDSIADRGRKSERQNSSASDVSNGSAGMDASTPSSFIHWASLPFSQATGQLRSSDLAIASPFKGMRQSLTLRVIGSARFWHSKMQIVLRTRGDAGTERRLGRCMGSPSVYF